MVLAAAACVAATWGDAMRTVARSLWQSRLATPGLATDSSQGRPARQLASFELRAGGGNGAITINSFGLLKLTEGSYSLFVHVLGVLQSMLAVHS